MPGKDGDLVPGGTSALAHWRTTLRGLLLCAGASVPLLPAAAQCPDGTPPPCPGDRRPAAPPARPSIAVLPFGSRSPDTADAYLADGMTEEVGNRLTQLGRLQVKAHGVVAAQWQRNPNPLDVARALRVSWYVHGSVRHVAPQLLVSVEMVRPATGEQVWAKRFARPDADLFAAQAEVAESVAVVVGGRLSPGERAVLARRPTRNNEAYRLYLYGNALLARRTQRDVGRSVDAFTQAVRLDPQFAGAWARLGLARVVQFSWVVTQGWRERLSPDSLLALAFAATRRALRADSLSAEAWSALASASMWHSDFGAAHAAFERSVLLDSSNAVTLASYGFLYGCTGLCLTELAIPLYRRALAIDPSARNTWRSLASDLEADGKLAEAEAVHDTLLALGPWAPAYVDRSMTRFVRGNGSGALADLAEAARLDSSYRNEDLRALYTIQVGDSAPARAVLARLRARADRGRPDFWGLALFSVALGLRDEALTALERFRAIVDPGEPRCSPTATCSVSINLWKALHSPVLAPLRGDPRFERLWAETRPRVPWLEGYH